MLYAILMLVSRDRQENGWLCMFELEECYVIEIWVTRRLESQDAGCRQIRDTPYQSCTTDMQAGSAGSGVGIVIWLMSKCFEVSHVSLANQKRALSIAV